MKVLETIVIASIDCLSGQLGIGKISTSLFNIWKQNLKLLEAEKNSLVGKLLIIYKAIGI
jgi:hypothetical protein